MNALRSLSLVASAIKRLLEMRVDLFAAEFELERMRLIRCLFLSILGATLLGTAVLVTSTLIVITVAEESRITVLGIIAFSLFATAGLCIGFSLHYVFGSGTPFKATTEALKEDGECLISLLRK
jgi:uncharacterized membrane protein YqjE